MVALSVDVEDFIVGFFEKFIIICRKNLCSLNKRNELVLFLIATLTSLLIASTCKLTVIRYCLMSVVTLRSYETAL